VSTIHIDDLEAAINWWRTQSPSPDGVHLARETHALADLYGHMIATRSKSVDEADCSLEARSAFEQWAATLPDSPCIAICSTSVGDEHCSGCGRSFDEVTRWTGMGLVEKRAVWHRITQQGHWLRFTAKYRDRLIEKSAAGEAAA
jgi:predicted Fe-S protein YdhL (DUF1289 family)